MLSLQDYKVRIAKIIDRLPDQKVIELMDYAAFLSSRYGDSKGTDKGMDDDTLMMQSDVMKSTLTNPQEDIYKLYAMQEVIDAEEKNR